MQIFRSYHPSDYKNCESLVNDAWQFDSNFNPHYLADIAKYLYTEGSVINSNFREVIEINNKVEGFIFGTTKPPAISKKQIWFGLNILRRILFVKNVAVKDKIKLLKSINIHETNRYKAIEKYESEIVLFVISKKYQDHGYGQKLLNDFIDYCRISGIKSIIVETNTLGASGFYEHAGFKHIGDFDSPLHEYVTRGGQPCLYEYRIQEE